MYQAIHGEEDKKDAPVGSDDESIIQNYNKLFNTEAWQTEG